MIPPVFLLNIFVTMVMLGIGLRVTRREMLDVLRDRPLLIRTLLVNCVVIPALGLLLVNAFALPPDVRVGLVLLAAIPGTPIALQFTRQAKTRLAFAAVLTFVLSVVSIALTPLAIELMPRIAEHSERPIVKLIASILLYIATPLCAGIWAGQRLPRKTVRLILPLDILATIVFAFLMWETRLARRDALLAITGHGTILAMALLLVVSMLIGWLIGGPDSESRRVLATATGMRSVIVVLYVARYCFPGTNVYMVPIVYLSLMVPANLVFYLAYEGWQRWRLAHA